MNQKLKRVLIVAGLVVASLCAYYIFDVPTTKTVALNANPVSANVPAVSDALWEQRLLNTVQIYTKDDAGHTFSVGTGFFLKDEPNIIMTDKHVLDQEGATYYQINLKDGRTYRVTKVMWESEQDDLAKIHIDTSDTMPDGFEICKREPQIAEDIWLIGHPFDMPWSVHKGTIASPTRSNIIEFKKLGYSSEYIELDIAMMPGMSGGPVITKDNCVIGIADFLYGGETIKDNYLTLSYATKNNRLLAAINAK
jgi:S1-C subfamily serine protease